MTSNDKKKGGFVDHFPSKSSFSSTNNDNSMFLNTDLIHEGISDDDLDMLLSIDIKSSAKPPKNLSPPAFTDVSLQKDILDEDALGLDPIDNHLVEVNETPTISVGEDELLELDEVLLNEPKLESELNLLDGGVTHSEVLNKEILTELDMNTDEKDRLCDTKENSELQDSVQKHDDTSSLDALELITPSKQQNITTSEDNKQTSTLYKSNNNKGDDKNESTASTTLKTVVKDITKAVKSRLSDIPDLDKDDGKSAEALFQKDTQTVSAAEDKTKNKPKNAQPSHNQTQKPKFVMKNKPQKANIVVEKNKETHTIHKIPVVKTAQPTSKSNRNKPLGKKTMTNENQAALIEKIQVDIDELKRKLHSMNSDFYNAATDSAVLISQVRELETQYKGDFNGTYKESRELRKVLVEARKIFNQLATSIDMIEESLETDLFEVESNL